ncbi:MAG: hypothetical protein ABI954_05235 [Pyrinomonadaceae bacterium]
MDKQDVIAILKLYELRRDEELRKARTWYFSEFNPTSAADIVELTLSGERESAYYRMVSSYWDMAASLVNNGAIDAKLFLDANTEHLVVFAKIQPFLAEVRAIFKEPSYHAHLEELVMKIPNAEEKLQMRRRLMAHWKKASDAAQTSRDNSE